MTGLILLFFEDASRPKGYCTALHEQPHAVCMGPGLGLYYLARYQEGIVIIEVLSL